MTGVWITNSSTSLEAMLNPLTAAIEDGFAASQISILENPDVVAVTDQFIDTVDRVFRAYGHATPDIERTPLEQEVAFERIRTHHRDAIQHAKEQGHEVAVDITPGRKFMSAIAFATGMRYGADHVFYFYLESGDYYGKWFPEIPRTAVNLYDFAEVV